MRNSEKRNLLNVVAITICLIGCASVPQGTVVGQDQSAGNEVPANSNGQSKDEMAASHQASPSNQDSNWPHFMGPRSNGTWNAPNTIDSFPETGPKFRWRTKLGPGYSGPAISDGRIFVTDRVKDDGKGKQIENAIRRAGQIAGKERVLCLDETTGKKIWEHVYDCPYKIAYPTGPRSTPTVDEDRVYTLGAMGRLICFTASTGTVVWEKELTESYSTKAPPWGYSSHPIVDGNSLIVAVGGPGSGVVAFDKKTGKEIWKAVTTFDIAYAPLVMFEKANRKQLIFWHAEAIVSLEPKNGKIHWIVKFPEKRNQSQTSISMPRIAGDHLLVTEYYKGALLLEIESDPPAVKEVWRSYKTDPRSRTALNALMTSPLVKDGFAYSIANDARGNGVFRCIDIATGEMRWTKTDWMTPKPLVFATAFIIENGDKYFMFNDIGELMIVRLSPEGFEELDRAKILEPTGVARGRNVVWCQPACANGHLVVRNDEEIVSVDLRK